MHMYLCDESIKNNQNLMWFLFPIIFMTVYDNIIIQAPVVQRLDNAITQTNIYPVDTVVFLFTPIPLDRDLQIYLLHSVIHNLNNRA